MSSTNKNVQAAMYAHTNLTVFAAVVEILEGGTIKGEIPAVGKIIAICKAEQQRQLRLMDQALRKENISAY